jgi:hypothetical protein
MVTRFSDSFHTSVAKAHAVNEPQRLWWKQAAADWALFEHLRGPARWRHLCHPLQALQMSSEKIAKASFRVGTSRPNKFSHLAVRGKSHPWPFSTWATPQKAEVFGGHQSPHPAAAGFFHSLLGLTKMLRRLSSVRAPDQQELAEVFSVSRFQHLERLLKSVRGIAKEIERLPPAIAGPDQINTEYPFA